ncbi:mechanosensitive ion channel family protein [Eggerthella sp. YY7918]|uniref:mechanosensitive ion channel family protein n=1 Tax=Eggerthella sp. (strain YY7918) TaxID=502558 RepID=UPI00021711A5|nr:mechanosensitive ion channel family protein [Eggerthella sp. YY7918]BAK45782.1 hypothetical protein EGYY_27900 [Eggerthella sp. YY7918]
MEELLQHIDTLVRADWVNTALSVVVILIITAIIARLITRFLRHLLHFNEEKNLPSSTIFVNIARGAVWILGVCVMLSTSFNVDVTAAIAALGIGGIAISLGFQDTISNLIGGLQVSLMRIVKPGDNIQVGTSTGVVKDVTWRHTTIRNAKGEEVIIPNSIINKTALVHLPPTNQVSVPIVVVTDGSRLDEVAHAIERTAGEAASSIGKVTKDPAVSFSAITESGFAGTIMFRMADSRTTARAGDAVLRAVAPLTRTHTTKDQPEGEES